MGNSPEPTAKGLDVKGSVRYDKYGNPILKHGMLQMAKNASSPDKRKRDKGDKLRHKVTFIDKVDKDKDFINTIYVLSYKKYNMANTFDPAEQEPEENGNPCCSIF